MRLDELKDMMARDVPQAEQEIHAAIRFAKQHLRGRSNAFAGALLGLLVGILFGAGDIKRFDQWAALIRADMFANQNTATNQTKAQ